MEKLMEMLTEWGARPEEAVRRMSGDEEFYGKLLLRFVNKEAWEHLAEMIRDQRYEEAFVISHRMKGSSLDLSLTPMTDALSALTEDLRDAKAPREHLPEDLESALVLRDQLYDLLRDTDIQ